MIVKDSIYYAFDPVTQLPPSFKDTNTPYKFGFVYTLRKRCRLWHSKNENYVSAYDEYLEYIKGWEASKPQTIATYKVVNGVHEVVEIIKK